MMYPFPTMLNIFVTFYYLKSFSLFVTYSLSTLFLLAPKHYERTVMVYLVYHYIPSNQHSTYIN